MRILKTLTFLAPFVLKGATKRPVKTLAGVFATYGLMLISILFISIAIFIYITKEYGADAAFLAIGLLALLTAGYLHFRRILRRKKLSSLPDKMEQDPLASKLPESLRDDPVIGSILKQINDNPVPATAVAVTLGMVIANEYFGD